MKKLLYVAVSSALFFLCSCSTDLGSEKNVYINLSFTSKAQINYQETAFTAEIQSTESGCSAVFIAPQELEGLKISYNGTAFSYSLGELEFTSPNRKETQQFLKLIYEALRSPDRIISKSENGYAIEGRLNDSSYYININKEQLTPMFIEFQNPEITVKLY